MTLRSNTVATLESYWTERLGVGRGAFDETTTAVGRAAEGGVQLFRRNGSLVVGAPLWLDGSLRRHDRLGDLDISDRSALEAYFETFGDVTRILGPAFYGYADRVSFEPCPSDARTLTAEDEPEYDRFRERVPEEEWERGGPELTPGETVGLFVAEDLVALADYEVWDGLLAHIAVVTHPDHRNEGYGRAVVSRAVERALSNGLITQYRTLDAWPWSVALANSLGFERFATGTLVVIE